MAYPVKFFHSGMAGAPVLSNNWGDLIGVLDACLVTGFNLKAVDSITSAAGVATVTVSAGHGYKVDQVVSITGCEQSAYNGEQRVTGITASTFTFDVVGTPDSPATTQTSISCKVAPLGWEKAFAGTNKAAYRSTDPASPRHYLRVDDSVKAQVAPHNAYNTNWAKWANVGICESMTDIDTIVGAQAPFNPNYPEQNWKQRTNNQWGWHKWYHAFGGGDESYGDKGAGDRNWVIVGDGRFFWFLTTLGSGTSWFGRVVYCFGDPISFKAGDAYGTVLQAHDTLLSANGAIYIGNPSEVGGDNLTRSCNVTGAVMLRNYTQLGGPIRWGMTSLNTNNSMQRMGRGGIPWPNGPDFALWLLPCYLRQEDGHMRGIVPGVRWMPQDRPYSDLTIIDNVVNEAGRKFLLARYTSEGETEYGQIAFDITGPWR